MDSIDLNAMAKGIYRLRQIATPDETLKEIVITSLMVAEACIGDCELRKDKHEEFIRIATQGE